jgi:hypothetical protein
MRVIEGTNPVEIQRLTDINTMEPLWAGNTTVYNSSGDIVGKINKNTGKIKMFIVST